MKKEFLTSKYKKLFWIILLLYFVYFLCCIPKYILYHVLANPMYHELNYNFWDSIYRLILSSNVLSKIYNRILFTIPNWTIIPMLVFNAGNMIYGYMLYRKKRGFFIVLAFVIITVLIMCDYIYLLLLPDWD